jgi:GAF domain-containing protein
MNDYLAKVHALSQELNSARDLRTVIDVVTDHLPRILSATYCSLFIMNLSSNELELKAHNHEYIGDDPFIHVDSQQQGIMNLTIEHGQSMIVRDIQDEIGLTNKDKYKSKSFMCILIKHEGGVRGVINLADKLDGQFEQNDLLIASIVAELLGPLLSHQDFCQI